MASQPSAPAIWHAIFPTPEANVPKMSPEELANLIQTSENGKDYIVVDARRTDFETASVKGALNLPAHSFYQTRSTITELLAPIPRVIFHCNSCSDGGRGPRTAGWYADELKKRGITGSEAFVLEGGVKRWIELYGEDETLTTKLPQLSS